MASKRVLKKASILLDPILKLCLSIFEAPGGAERQNGFQNSLKNGLGIKAPSSTPGAHFDPLVPRCWSLRKLIFEASAASSAAWPEARSPRSAWQTNGGGGEAPA